MKRIQMKLQSLTNDINMPQEFVAMCSTDMKPVGVTLHATSAGGKGYKMEFMYK
jgi:hypothetical protein